MAIAPAGGLKNVPTMYGKPVEKQLPTDPFGNPIDVHQAFRDLGLGTLPPVLTPAQALAQAQARIRPAVGQITGAVNQQAAAGQQAVSGWANALAADQEKSGLQGVRDTYAPIEASTAASSAALSDRLTGAGNEAADGLAARLASIREPGVTDPIVAALRTDAGKAGNALYSTGSASLEHLLSNEAAAATYAGKLPGITRLSGIQQAGNVQATAAKSLADQLGPVYAQVPGLAQSLESANQNKIDTYNSRRDNIYGTVTGQNLTRATAKAGFAAGEAKAAPVFDSTKSLALGYRVDQYGNAIPNLHGGADQMPGFKWNATNTGTVKVAPPKTAKPVAPPKLSPAASAANKYQTDIYGHPILDKAGNRQPYKPYVKPTTTKDTAAADAKAKAATLKDARDVSLGIITSNLKKNPTYISQPKTDKFGITVKGPDGKPVMTRVQAGDKSAGSYYSAIHQIEAATRDELTAIGYDEFAITRYAQAMVNQYFKPGQGGRPGTGKQP